MRNYKDILDTIGVVTGVCFMGFTFLCCIIPTKATCEELSVKSKQDAVMAIYKPNETIPTKEHIVTHGKWVTHCDITLYHPTRKECNEDYKHTASNLEIDFAKLKSGELHYCAVSRDLLWKIPLNSVIHIDGHGTYLVCDKLNPRFNHRIDIMFHPSNPTMFKEEKVKVTLL